jgi:hypothetical protein
LVSAAYEIHDGFEGFERTGETSRYVILKLKMHVIAGIYK